MDGPESGLLYQVHGVEGVADSAHEWAVICKRWNEAAVYTTCIVEETSGGRKGIKLPLQPRLACSNQGSLPRLSCSDLNYLSFSKRCAFFVGNVPNPC